MKQTCYLLASVLVAFISAGSAKATAGDVITSLSDLSSSKCYTITTERGRMVANASKTAVCSSLAFGSATASASTEEADGQWAILSIDGTGYYLFNMGTKRFLKSNCHFADANLLGDALTVQEATSPNGNYKFKITSGSNTLNNDNWGNIVLNGWGTEDAGNLITITEAGDIDSGIGTPLTITYDYYINGQKIYSDNKTAYQALAFPTPTQPGYTEATPPTGTVQASDNGKTFNIEATVLSSFPFKYSAEGTAWKDLFWYRLKINNKYIVYDESVSTDKCSLSTDAAAAVNDNIAFAFVGNDPYNGFRIVNHAKGENYTLSNSNNPYDGNTGGSTFPTMKERSSLTVGTAKDNDVEKFYVAKATSTAFFVQMNTYDGDEQNTYVRMNDRGSLAYWNFGSGTGSYFTVERIIPGDNTVVSSLDNIVQGQAYTITAAGRRGSFIYTANGLSSTNSTGIAVDMTDKNQQFLFAEHDGTYYLYSVGAGAFINVTGKDENNNRAVAVAGKPVNTSLQFLASTNSSYETTYPVVLSVDEHQVGISNGYTPAVISHYNDTADEGNSLCIKAVTGVTYDMTEINALLDQSEEKDFDVARAAIVAEVEDNGRISVLFSATDVEDTKAELAAIAYSEEDGLDASVAKLAPVLETFYKKAESKKFSIRNTPDTYFLTATKTEIRAKDADLGLDGVFEVKYNGNKKFYLRSVYDSVYVNKPVSHNTAPTTSTTPVNDFYIGALDGNTNKVYFAYEKADNNSIHFSTSYTYHTCGWTYEADNSQWVISEVTDEQYADLEPWAALAKAIDIAGRYDIGSGLCQYSDGGKTETARDMLKEKTASADEVSAAITAISPDNFTLNMPANGQFIRIKDSAGNYMTCNNSSSRTAFSSDKDESSVFCYTGSALIAYKTGFYASRSSNFPCNMTSVTTESEGTVYHIHASKLNKGKYLVSFGGDTRFMYTVGNAGSYNGGPSTVNNAGYEFTLEEVDTIPVTISSAKMGSLYSPVALQIPEGVTAYTGVYDSQSSTIRLTALKGVVPANTGVIIEGEAKTYDFATTTGEEGASCLSGTAPGIANVTGAYTLQIVNGNIGLYKYSGENLNGFKAYFVNSSGSKGFSFVKDDDPTGISTAGADVTGSGKCYDLQGNRVVLPLKNRIYILNGKKVLIK